MKKKHASRRKRTSDSVLLVLAISAFCAMPDVTLAQLCNPTTNWTGTSGSWFTEGNWSNGVPDSGKNANINNAGTAQINTSVPLATACNLILGFETADTGSLSVNGGNLTVAHELEVGGFGNGTVNITNGSSVSAGYLTIAALRDASGSVSAGTVSVNASTLTVDMRADIGGDNGNPGGVALITVTNGGSVTVTAPTGLHVYSSGTLTGNGTVSTSNGTTIEGTLSPSGRLSIGGDLTFGGTAATMQCNVTPSSADNVDISGAATLNGRLSVTMTGTFTPGTTFTLLHSQGVLSGAFSSVSIKYSTNQCFVPQINYDYVGNHVYLYLASTCW